MSFNRSRYLKWSAILIWGLTFLLFTDLSFIYNEFSHNKSIWEVDLKLFDLLVYGPVITLMVAPIVSFYMPIAYYVFLDGYVDDKYPLYKLIYYAYLMNSPLILLNPLVLFGADTISLFSFYMVSLASVMLIIGSLIVRRAVERKGDVEQLDSIS